MNHIKKTTTIIVVLCSLIVTILTVFVLRSQFQSTYDQLYAKGVKDHASVLEEIKTIVSKAETKIDISTIYLPKENDAYATISVDRVNFKKPLYYGDNEEILNLGIGQYMGSGLPGQGKPILLAGHNGTEFYQLQNMKKDDVVKIKTSWGTYTYQIYDMEIMAAEDFDEQRLNEDKEYLIMYCCYPFDSPSTPDRYFVYASFVSGPSLRGNIS